MAKLSRLLRFARLTTPESYMLMDVARVYDMVSKMTGLGIQTKLEIFAEKEKALEWLFAED